MRHELKSYPSFFAPIESGVKTFEIRLDDRDYKVGDELFLREWCTEKQYSGRSIVKRIAYILREPGFGLERGYVCLGLETGKKIIKM